MAILERLPVTLFLTGFAALLAVLMAVPLALLAALKRDSMVDSTIRTGFQIGLSMPVFYIGIVLLTFFAARLHWFPVGGFGNTLGQNLYHLFLPALTLAFSLSAVLMRNLRNSLIEVLNADYVDFARAKGLRNRLVLGRHVLRNGLISTVALFGLNIGTLIGGAVITESVFAIPGVGRLMIDSIYGRDYPVIQGLTLALALLVCLVFLATDIGHHLGLQLGPQPAHPVLRRPRHHGHVPAVHAVSRIFCALRPAGLRLHPPLPSSQHGPSLRHR